MSATSTRAPIPLDDQRLHLAIVGAGICGLTLATALISKGADVRLSLLEADGAPDSRSQGYAIGLKDASGLGVLEKLGLRSALLEKGATRIRTFRVTDQNGRELLAATSFKDGKDSTYRVKRTDIKAVLLEALSSLPVQCGKTCISYTQDAEGVTLSFDDAVSVRADYVIACDGAGSMFRKKRYGNDKHYSGLSSVYGDAHLDTDNEPLLDEAFFITLGENGSSLLAYKQQGGVLFSYSFKAENPDEISAFSREALAARVRSGTAGWHPLVGRIVANLDEATLGTRAFYDWVPEGPLLDGRVLLIGDAAHPMTPFQGQAANVGMQDAFEVATLFSQHARDERRLARSLVKVERIIRKRGKKNVLQSRETGLDFHITDRKEQRKRALILKTVNFGLKTLALLRGGRS